VSVADSKERALPDQLRGHLIIQITGTVRRDPRSFSPFHSRRAIELHAVDAGLLLRLSVTVFLTPTKIIHRRYLCAHRRQFPVNGRQLQSSPHVHDDQLLAACGVRLK